jgi:hypothetical protein
MSPRNSPLKYSPGNVPNIFDRLAPVCASYVHSLENILFEVDGGPAVFRKQDNITHCTRYSAYRNHARAIIITIFALYYLPIDTYYFV